MILGFILEGLVGILLVVTVIYCAILDRRLRALRDGQDGLKAIIEGLDSATLRAQTGIAELRVSGDAVTARLQDQVGRARALADELEIMVEAASRLADRLENGWSANVKHETARPALAPPGPSVQAPPSSQKNHPTPHHAAEPPPRHSTAAPAVRSEPPYAGGAVPEEGDTSAKWEDALLKALREAR